MPPPAPTCPNELAEALRKGDHFGDLVSLTCSCTGMYLYVRCWRVLYWTVASQSNWPILGPLKNVPAYFLVVFQSNIVLFTLSRVSTSFWSSPKPPPFGISGGVWGTFSSRPLWIHINLIGFLKPSHFGTKSGTLTSPRIGGKSTYFITVFSSIVLRPIIKPIPTRTIVQSTPFSKSISCPAGGF